MGEARDLRLLPLAASVWGAALLGVYVAGAAWIVAVGCLGGAALLMCVLARDRRRSQAVRGGLAVVALVTMAAVSTSIAFASPARDRAVEADGPVVEVIGDVTSSASIGRDGRLWFEVQTRSIGIRDRPVAIAAPVRIGVDPADGFDLGATIRVVGEAAATEPGERATLVLFASDAEILRPAEGIFAVAAEARHGFVERAIRLPEPGAGLLPGLAVGDTRAVSAQLNEDMRASGLSHLTAVSGDIVT
jgi:competence protein ComEC